MTEPNPKYPVPDRSDYRPQPDAEIGYDGALELGSASGVLPDGRPAVVEDWYDKGCQIFCRTVWYSVLDAEAWSEERHYRFLETNDLLRGKTYPGRSIGLGRTKDASGNDVFSVTVVLKDEG